MSDRRRAWIPRPSAENHLLGREALLSLDARIKPDFKRAVGLGLLAAICLAVGDKLGGLSRNGHVEPAVILLAAAFAVVGATAVRSAARESFRVTSARGGPSAASALRLVVSVAGYGLILLGILQLLSVNLSSLLVGGAVTGVVVGIAAQQSLGNFFAGLVLMFARPYIPGQRVIVRSGAMGGTFEGEIVVAGLLFTTMVTDEGPVHLPNAGLLSAAIGPAPQRAQRDTAV
jgi:small conductance mechanosensitive channel